MRTVSDRAGFIPNLQMSAIGYIIGIAIALLLLPLLPVIVLLWLGWRVVGSIRPDQPLSWRNAPA